VTTDPQLADSPNADDAQHEENIPSYIDQMNTLASGTVDWPSTSGPVVSVQGVIVAGDLTSSATRNQKGLYKTFVRDALELPLYDGLGNHDFDGYDNDPIDSRMLSYLNGELGTACKSKTRAASDELQKCDGGPRRDDGSGGRFGLDWRHKRHGHYAWTWGPLHFIMLNEHAGGTVSHEQVPGPLRGEALQSLTFLKWMLKKYEGEPVIVVQHFGFDDFSLRTSAELRPCSDGDGGWYSPALVSNGEISTGLATDALNPGEQLRLSTSGGPEWVPNPDTGPTYTGSKIQQTSAGSSCLGYQPGYGGQPELVWTGCSSAPLWTQADLGGGQTGLSTQLLFSSMCLYARAGWWSTQERAALAEQLKSAAADGTQPLAFFSGHEHARSHGLWSYDAPGPVQPLPASYPFDGQTLPALNPGQTGDDGFFVVRVIPTGDHGAMRVYSRDIVTCTASLQPDDHGNCWDWTDVNGASYFEITW